MESGQIIIFPFYQSSIEKDPPQRPNLDRVGLTVLQGCERRAATKYILPYFYYR